MQPARPRILLLTDYFLPGYHGGGPVTSIGNLVDALRDEFAFTIVTRDRDLAGSNAYPAEDRERVRSRFGDIRYLSPGLRGLLQLRQIFLSDDFDLLHLNSLFSPGYTIWPLVLHRVCGVDVPVVLAPRGELSPGALTLKAAKKKAYLSMARGLRLYDPVLWQASTDKEANEIRHHFHVSDSILISPNIPSVGSSTISKKPQHRLKVLFLSRVAPKKNLKFLLEVLSRFEKPVTLSIVGPIEDQAYWRACRPILKNLPDQIRVSVSGPVPPHRVHGIYQDHDLFFLPTLGENFGHVIVEALSAGCPVLISDRTPWTNLEEDGIGWAIPLDQPERYLSVLERTYAMSSSEYGRISSKAKAWAQERLNPAVAVQAQREVYELALARNVNQ